MDDVQDPLAVLDADRIGNVRELISTLARTNGVTGQPEPIDTFIDAVSRLADTAVNFDHFERLIIGLVRRGFVSDKEGFALHAAYLRQRSLCRSSSEATGLPPADLRSLTRLLGFPA